LEERKLKENATKLADFILEGSIHAPVSFIDFTIDIGNEYLNQIKEQAGTAIVYLVNSECSVCIADYISFLKTVEKMKNTTISVYGILNTNHEAILAHYLEKSSVGTDKLGIVHILTESLYPFRHDEPQKNVIIFTNGNLIKKIAFSDSSFIF
jgi:hypothetical protein